MDKSHRPQRPLQRPFKGGVNVFLGLMALFFLAMAFGCSSVSDEEMARLREETYALEAELAAVRREAVILDRVLTSVYKERDSLVDQINRASSEASGLTPQGPSLSPSEAGQVEADSRSRVYRAKAGDTLSLVAQRHGATVGELLDLNPHIRNRSSQMVWIGDEVVLPGRGGGR
jgi:LysM repeat protein